MKLPDTVRHLHRRLTLAYGGVWALSVVLFVALSLLISARSIDGELDEAVQLMGMAVYGLAWIDEDGFHQELELDEWLLDDDTDIRVMLADGTVLFERTTLNIEISESERMQIMDVGDFEMLNGVDGNGVAWRGVRFPLFDHTGAVLGLSSVSTARSPYLARWVRFATTLSAAALMAMLMGLWLGSLLARRSLAPLVASMGERELLLAAAAHELRTPLASLTAIIESAQAGDEPPEKALPRLSGVLRVATERVTRLMTWARLGSGDRVQAEALRTEKLRLDLLVEQVIDEEPIVLTGEACVVHGDPTALAVAVRNLLENAAVHGAPPISVAVEGGRITVCDSGSGFAEIEAAHQPFSSRSDSPGSGLGLDIVRRVAEAHGGAMHLENCAKGGARVVLDLSRIMDG